MKSFSIPTVLLLSICISFLFVQDVISRDYYEIKLYHYSTKNQEKLLDEYFKNAYLPAIHKQGIPNVGVFKPIDKEKKVFYVLIPLKNMEDLLEVDKKLEDNSEYVLKSKAYQDAVYNEPPYDRIEIIFLKAFSMHQQLTLPNLKSSKKERVYELRSYESATEKLYWNKVQMFNEGGEVELFKRLNFNAVFYAEVITGSHMPNIMYLTTFENKKDRDEHWESFGNDPFWKELSAKPEYQNNVSKADITLMHPTTYSDI